jgi:hypothetical protein
MRGGGVRHPERAQRNIRLVLLRGAGGLGVSPRSKKMSLANPLSPWGERGLSSRYLSEGRRLE